MTECRIQAFSRLSNGEVLRKAIDISGLAVSFVCIHLFNAPLFFTSLFLITICYAMSELTRVKGINIPIFSTITQKAARTNSESDHFVAAPIFFAIGIILTLLIFPTHIAYASIAVLTLGDGFAGIFGKIFGKTPLFFNKKKKFEGTIFGFIFAFLGSSLFINPLEALVAAALGMLAECLPLPMDDNLVTPLSAGTALMLFT